MSGSFSLTNLFAIAVVITVGGFLGGYYSHSHSLIWVGLVSGLLSIFLAVCIATKEHTGVYKQ